MRNYFTSTLFIILALLLSAVPSFAQNIDYQFNPLIKGIPSVRQVITQEDGKIILTGNITSVGDRKTSSLVRLNTDGSLDETFAPELGNANIRNMQCDADGKILMIKKSSPYASYFSYLTRLNTDGSEDKNFQVDDRLGVSNTYTIQGRKYIALSTIWANQTIHQEIIRLNNNGSVDSTFHSRTIDGNLFHLDILPDHKILAFIQTDSGRLIQRLHEHGDIDHTFNIGTGFQETSPSINLVVIQPDGKIIIQGQFTSFNGIETGGFMRLNTDGSVDQTFVMPGPAVNAFDRFQDIQVLPSGKILVLGYEYDYGQMKANFLLMRLHQDGSLDTSFPVKKLQAYNDLYENINKCNIAVHGETVYLAGSFSAYDSVEKFAIVAINTDGVLNEAFNPKLGGQVRIENAVKQPDGKILIAGNFVEINGTPIINLARLNHNGTLDTTFSNEVIRGLNNDLLGLALALQADGKLLIGGSFRKLYDQSITGILRLHSDGTLDNSFNINISDAVFGVEDIYLLKDDHILVRGRHNQSYLCKLDANGARDESFAVELPENLDIYTTLLDQDKILVGGEITYHQQIDERYTTVSKAYLGRYNLDGSQDSSFQEVHFKHTIYTLGKTNNRIFAGGELGGGHSNKDINPLFQINKQGEIIDPYSLSTNGLGGMFAVLPISDSSLIIGGYFEKMNKFTRHSLAKVDIKGRISHDFIYDVDRHINGIIQENEDQIFIYGHFNQINGIQGFSSIARLNINTPRSPVDLSAVVDARKGIVLTWKDSSAVETGYKIYRSSSNSSGYELIDSVAANVTTYVDASIAPSNTYHYQVISIRDTLESDFTNQVTVSTTDLSKPETPQDLTLESENAVVYLKWELSDEISGYIVERSSGDGFMVVDTVNSNTYIDSHIIPETTYLYRVKAYTFLGESDYTPVVDFTHIITAVAAEPHMRDVMAYPNPSAGTFTIPMEKSVNLGQISIFNGENKKMQAIKVSYQQRYLIVDLSALETGIYFLKVNSKESNQIYRLIKE